MSPSIVQADAVPAFAIKQDMKVKALPGGVRLTLIA